MCDSPKTGTIRWVYKSGAMCGIVNGLMLFKIEQKCTAVELKHILECFIPDGNGKQQLLEIEKYSDCVRKAEEMYVDIVNAVFPSKIGE